MGNQLEPITGRNIRAYIDRLTYGYWGNPERWRPKGAKDWADAWERG